jgi:acyl-CoA hydrolase
VSSNELNQRVAFDPTCPTDVPARVSPDTPSHAHDMSQAASEQEATSCLGGAKTVADSSIEIAHTVLYQDINGVGRLYGGRLMEWIDEAAAIVARRHCGGAVTTACVDQLQFRHPAYRNDIVDVVARVTYVGNTSLEVRVDSYVEDVRDGSRQKINRAFLTLVHVDDAGTPLPIRYKLLLSTDEEKLEYQDALKRLELRNLRREEHY